MGPPMKDSTTHPFDHAKPKITAGGFRTAVRDYTELTVVEELAANSYDADATILLTLLDSRNNHLYIIDNGFGFNEDAIRDVATLGGGDKRDLFSRQRKRHYLGSYGYGLKSSLNIATKTEITTFSAKFKYAVTIDWSKLDSALQPDFQGYAIQRVAKERNIGTGTIIKLFLKNPTSKDHLEKFGDVLSNLPNDDGNFTCYYGFYEAIGSTVTSFETSLRNLDRVASRLANRNKITLAGTSLSADIENCDKDEIVDKDDKSVRATFYFAGMDGNGVRHLKPGLRGIYVRIHGRLLKQSFTARQYTYNISKWVKFESGLRVEMEVDWLRDQISLSREGVRFSNPKLESDFKSTLARLVSRFIQPRLKSLQAKKSKFLSKKLKQRLELARKRVAGDADTLLARVKTGFNFRPETDGELALLISDNSVLKQLGKDFVLIDYNDQAAFDALLWDKTRRELVYTEFEPTLIEFLNHKEKEGVQLVIVWTLGKWRIGARKKGRGGHFELICPKATQKGEYSLLEFASGTSKKPRKDYRVFALEHLLG